MHPTRIIKQAPGTCHPGQEILAGREDAAILASWLHGLVGVILKLPEAVTLGADCLCSSYDVASSSKAR